MSVFSQYKSRRAGFQIRLISLYTGTNVYLNLLRAEWKNTFSRSVIICSLAWTKTGPNGHTSLICQEPRLRLFTVNREITDPHSTLCTFSETERILNAKTKTASCQLLIANRVIMILNIKNHNI